ncbi:unnamed protein product, partial [Mesorhabditis belari]|uniref:Myosin motor domain-containing protein n=1 Tax=Mesorhabditis belari TaxID=2138241 RepID=A0AAF3J7P5_9BILA
MLDEECIVPKATDLTLAQKLNDQHLGKHPNFEKPKPPKGKQAEAHFAMKHYAGTVRYNCTNWLEKNKDPLNDTVVACMKASNDNALLRTIWDDYVTQEEQAELQKSGAAASAKKKGKSGSMMTVSMLYRESLNNLMTMLHKTHPHFIRCIIPNEKKQSGVLDAALVMNQLTCNGVLEGIRICRKGFPNRMMHADLVHRYAILAATEAKSDSDPKKCAANVMGRMVKEGYVTDENFKVGVTKVFFKAGILAHLEDIRDEKLAQIFTLFQAFIRSYLGATDKKRREQQRIGLLIVQRNVKSWCGLRTWDWFKLYGKVKPLIYASKFDEQLDALNAKLQEVEGTLKKEAELRSQLESQNSKILAEKNQLFAHLEKAKASVSEHEAKVNHLESQHSGAVRDLDDVNDALAIAEESNSDGLRAKKRAEGELDGLKKQLQDLQMSLRKGESERQSKEHQIRSLQDEMQHQDETVAKLSKEKKHQEEMNRKLVEDLHSEEDKSELEDLNNRLDEQGGATQAQSEVNKKREAELAKLRRDIEEAGHIHDNQFSALKKKHTDAVAELSEQINHVNKSKNKAEKDKVQAQRDAEGLQSLLDQEVATKVQHEKLAKQFESQLSELQSRVDDQGRELHDLTSVKGRLSGQNSDLGRQLEDVDSQVANINRVKSQILAQLDEAKRAADDEARERQALQAAARNAQADAEQVRSALEEEVEAKNDVNRQLSKANAEIQQWKSRFEGEGMLRADEIEEAKRKQQQRIQELTDSIEAATQKIAGLDKSKARIAGELDDAQVDADRANSYASTLEKKQRDFDDIVSEWKHKSDDLAAQVDSAQRDARNAIADLHRAKAAQDELGEIIEGLRRENKALGSEIKDLSDQLGEGGRSVHEMQKIIRRLETEKEELQKALDEAENALEAEEAKVMRAQVEVSQIRSEIEKRIQEKEAEFESTRKNHQKALESMQASIQTEAKSKNELLKSKKKLEGDINELEIALDHANKNNADTQKNLRKHQEQIRELQLTVEEEQRQKDEVRDQLQGAEKRAQNLEQDKDELKHAFAEVDHQRRQAENDARDSRDQANELQLQASTLSSTKRKLEGEIAALHSDLDETMKEFRLAEENSKKAIADATRLAEELKQEQEHGAALGRSKTELEQRLKEFQVRLDEAEAAALKGGKKTIAKLEQRIRELEAELDGEQRRYAIVLKEVQKTDRRTKELQFQIDEDKKNFERLNDLVDKLQTKIKTQKRQIEDAEELANTNLQKFRGIQAQLEDTEERADSAEDSLTKLRSKTRAGTSVGPGLQGSASVAVMRAPSRGKF